AGRVRKPAIRSTEPRSSTRKPATASVVGSIPGRGYSKRASSSATGQLPALSIPDTKNDLPTPNRATRSRTGSAARPAARPTLRRARKRAASRRFISASLSQGTGGKRSRPAGGAPGGTGGKTAIERGVAFGGSGPAEHRDHRRALQPSPHERLRPEFKHAIDRVQHRLRLYLRKQNAGRDRSLVRVDNRVREAAVFALDRLRDWAVPERAGSHDRARGAPVPRRSGRAPSPPR